ncbi:MAG: type VI secretion system tube protein Hcp [Desulfovibrionales bacterium]|nr:type VI secretion system tube protein Hcp [Desulfovibrionales bacterium]
MPTSAYLKLDGIKGPCKVSGFEDCIEIASYSNGISQAVTTSRSSGGNPSASGAAFHAPFTLTKTMCPASPDLKRMALKGDTFKTGTLTLTRMAGDKIFAYYKYDMKDVLIADYQVSGGTGGIATERLSITYSQIKDDHIATDETGQPQGHNPTETSLITGETS